MPDFIPQEPGFLVRSPCGREWFVPLEAVGRDYAEFLVENDGLSPEEAARQSNEVRSFWPVWFAEQCYMWVDIDRLGRLVKTSTLFKTKKALDNRRGSVVRDYDEILIP
jgi:hypothetical protein